MSIRRLVVLGTLAATATGMAVAGQSASATDVCTPALAGATACAGADANGDFSTGGVNADTAESVRVYDVYGPRNTVCIKRVYVSTSAPYAWTASGPVTYQCY